MINSRFPLCLLALALTHAFPSTSVRLVADNQTVQFSEASFDKMNFDLLTVLGARKRCEDRLAAVISLVESATMLTDQQKQEIELAGQIDIHRFFSRYAIAKQDLTFGAIPADQWQQLFAKTRKKIEPLKMQYASGLHGESSLFWKTMTTVLRDDQYQQVQAMFGQRRIERYLRFIQLTLAEVDRKVPLSVTQRDQITNWLLTKTEPPVEYGDANGPIFAVLRQMDQIREDLVGIFADNEMLVIGELIDAGMAAEGQQVLAP